VLAKSVLMSWRLILLSAGIVLVRIRIALSSWIFDLMQYK